MTLNLLDYFPVDLFGKIIAHDGVALGMSGATVSAITTTQGSYILRLYHGDQRTWQRSLGIHRLVADHGIAPPLLHVDEKHQATVSQKIAGISFGAAVSQPASQQAALVSLTATLAKLHGLPMSGLPRTDALGFAHDIWTAQSQRLGFPAWITPIATRLAKIAAILVQHDRQVLTHGDLNPANILWDGTRVWLVDWDGAGLSHPYLDMATIANFLSLPDESSTALLALQEQSPINPTQHELFKAYRDLARIVYGCIFLRMIPDLAQVEFSSRAMTPTLSQCFTRLAAGELSMTSVGGQALIGAAFFKQYEQGD